MSQLTVKVVYNGDTRRFSILGTASFMEILQLIQKLYNLAGEDWILKYTDDEGDWIQLSSDLELEEAKRSATKNSILRIQIYKKLENVKPQQIPQLQPQQPKPLEGRVHFGVSCDNCGFSPIVGFRYKCDDCDNYDLCSNCFNTQNKHIVNHSFSAIEIPVPMSSFPFMGGIERPTGRSPQEWGASDDFDETPDFNENNQQQKNYNVKFLEDATIADGTELPPNTNFTKIWRFKNEGVFPQESQLRLIDGHHMNGPIVGTNVAPVQLNQEFEVAVDLTTPNESGVYKGIYQFVSNQGERFGDRVFVEIKVVNEGNSKSSTQDYVVPSTLKPEWEPLLKQLHEMGFVDTTLNIKTLIKTNGDLVASIQQLVNTM